MNDNQPSPWGQPSNENEPPPSPKKTMWPFILTVVGVVVLVFIIAWVLSDGLTTEQSANLAYDFLLLALIGAGLIGHIVSNPGQALRNLASWVIIFGILGIGYSVWTGNGRLARELNPAAGEIADNAITFRADQSGHFYVKSEVNGSMINFMIDTGATHIVFKKTDAEKIGYNLDDLTFNLPASTANGIVYSAQVNIATVEVGPIKIENIDGFVNQGDLDVSLLGMSFLNRLSGYEVSDGLLTLYP